MWKKVALLTLLLAASRLAIERSTLANEPDESVFCSKGVEKIVDKKSGDYRVSISYAHDRACQRLEILKRGQLVFRDEGIDNHYFLGNEYGGGDKRAMFNIIGHGVQLVVKKWTGGMHCCNSLLVFDLGHKFRKIAEICAGNYEAEIIDLNHDGVSEIRVLDDFLAYQFSSFAYSATAEVVLKYTGGSYSVAPEFMKRIPPRRELLNAKFPRWRRLLRKQASPEWPPPSLIQTMTDLIFTGDEKAGFDLVERVWPSDVAGKDDFLRSYREALAESKYYAQVSAKRSAH